MNEQPEPDAPDSANVNPTCWDAAKYESAAGDVAAELGSDVLAWLQDAGRSAAGGPSNLSVLQDLRGRRVLDLGCGDGDLSQRLLAAGAELAAFDSSPEMVAAAVARGVPAVVLDAVDVDQPAEWRERFELVFTNAVLHWIADHSRVFAGVRQVLRQGGVFAGECGGGDNVQIIRSAVTQACADFGYWSPRETAGRAQAGQFPWNFVSPEDFRTNLERAGLRVLEFHCFKRRPVLTEGVVGWLDAFGSSIVPEVQGSARRELWERAAEHARAGLYEGEAGVWHADYTRLRWLAVRESL